MHRSCRLFSVGLAHFALFTIPACRDSQEPKRAGIQHDPTPSVAVTTPARKPTVVEQSAERHDGVEVKLTWPLLDLGAGRAGQTLSTRLEDALRKEADDVEKERAASLAEDPHAPFLDGWNVDIACRATLVAPEAVSVLCYHDQFTGGAHGQHWATSHVDLVEHDAPRPLSLHDLYGAKGLELLAPVVAASLARQEAPDALSGDPDGKWLLVDDKLAVFCADRAGLAFVFAPYVVGPYAAGGFLARVDWATARAVSDTPKTLDRLRAATTSAGAIVESCGEERDEADATP